MDGEHKPEQGEGRLPSTTSPTFPINGQIPSEEPATFNPGSLSEFNSRYPPAVQMYHTGSSSHDVENPWAQEPANNSGSERRELQSDVRDNSFVGVENVANGQAPLSPESTNSEPPTSSMHPTPYDFGHGQTEEAQPVAYSNKLQSNNPFLKSVQQNTTQQYEGSLGQSELSSPYNEALNGQGNDQGGMRKPLCKSHDRLAAILANYYILNT